ncbi:MAG: inositol monophosphatase [Cytophagaceae bacterium]|jgi:myo-inositol-1(or 4)-monophosphatase|nr:inositol monophosphatase [Cytophagaceae bacterium]
MTPEALKQLCLHVTKVARSAGDFQLVEARKFDPSIIEYKGSNDLVSYVDKETELLITSQLQSLLPEAGFITEEGTMVTSDKAYQWVIDPLDGTTNYLHQLPLFSVSIGLLYKQNILLGVVYVPYLNECFYAWSGGGSWLNGEPIHVSRQTTLNTALVATGFPYSLLNKSEAYFSIIKEFVERTHGVRRLGSAAIDLCYVAAGRFEMYFEFNLKTWDVAAGILIVQEAGGKVSNFMGSEEGVIEGREVVASNGGIHPACMDVIESKWIS